MNTFMLYLSECLKQCGIFQKIPSFFWLGRYIFGGGMYGLASQSLVSRPDNANFFLKICFDVFLKCAVHCNEVDAASKKKELQDISHIHNVHPIHRKAKTNCSRHA